MNPPTEQLIRDYLNRLSVAARTKLGFRERQALLDRTRMQIEMDCGGLSTASAEQVRKALAGLGDPMAIVEVEYDRIVAELASPRQLQVTAAGAVDPAAGPMSAPVPEPAGGPEPDPVPEPAGSGGRQDTSSTPRAAGRPRAPARLTGVAGTTRGVLWRLMDATAALVRHRPLEAAALVLLGVGGAAFPPVWLLGAVLVMTSKKWDLHDKWIGLVAPVLLVISGTALVVVLGGEHPSLASYAWEAWLGAGRIGRVVALVGAGYLLWRLQRGPRDPRQPPWNTPHRTG
jgi:hypothetical protein